MRDPRDRNQPSVARLSRRFKSTKAELSANVGPAPYRAAPRNCYKTGALALISGLYSLRRFRRGLFGALVDHLVDDAEVTGHLRGEELVAFQRILDRLVGLAGVLRVDL